MMTTLRYGILLAALGAASAGMASCYVDKTGAPPDRPYLSSLSPSSVVAGAPGFVLTIKGYGFRSTDIVSWQGAPKAGTFVSSEEVRVPIDSSDIATAGTAAVALYRGMVYDQLWLVIKKAGP